LGALKLNDRSHEMKIAIFGAGSVGGHLSKLFTDCGHDVVVCLRPGSTRQIAQASVGFAEGARSSEVVVVAIPFTSALGVLGPIADELKGKVVVDCTNPLNEDWSPLLLGQEHSAGETLASALPGAHVVKAFNTIFADVMSASQHDRAGQRITALVAGDHAESKAVVLELAKELGFAPLDVGPLRVARQLEAMAHLNIQIAVAQGGGTHAAFVYHQVKA
jgi:8-hydroxy-5-deazaflavin:NADPH oxidoreductase